ncbi:hypothetical protein P7C73_g2980, partial [Tremellales sp. Uapishka_1]
MDVQSSPSLAISSPSKPSRKRGPSSELSPTRQPKAVRPPTFAHDNEHEEPSEAGEGDVDEEEEFDELVSEGEQEGGNQTPSSSRHTCKWGDCALQFDERDDLVKHLHEDHVRTGKQTYVCEWIDCTRRGQKQATRHSLMTHMRAHTGERPYTCPKPGCAKNFTRSDALSKHLRTVHGIISDPPSKSKKKPSTQPVMTQKPLAEGAGTGPVPKVHPPAPESKLSSAEQELCLDPDLEKAILAMRSHPTFWSISVEEAQAVKAIRAAHPRTKKKGKDKHGDESDDGFDEGASIGVPLDPKLEGTIKDLHNPSAEEIPVLGRGRYQHKYLVAKAKLMLAFEENVQRRQHLVEALAREEKMDEEEAKLAKWHMAQRQAAEQVNAAPSVNSAPMDAGIDSRMSLASENMDEDS